MKPIRRSLILRIAIPVVVVVLGLGLSLHYFVHSSISEFARGEIQRDLQSLSHRLYSICNINYDNLLQNGMADNPESLIIKQAMSLGQFEDFFRQEGLEGLVVDKETGELLLTTAHTGHFAQMTTEKLQTSPEGKVEDYFIYHFDFTPWKWRVFLLKNEEKYASLVSRVEQVHLYTIGLLFFVALILVLMIYQSVRGPISAIIKPLKNNSRPGYRGIAVFEYLSDTIRDMMNRLQESQEKYRSLVETTTDIVWEIDRNGVYTYASPAVKAILGYEPEEMVGSKPFDRMPDEEADRLIKQFSEIVASEKPIERLENRNFHKNGSIVVLETSGAPIFDAGGTLAGYRGIDRDVTKRLQMEEDQKKLENQLLQLQKLESIGTLAGGIAHDFNNLLTVILGNISMAKEDCSPESRILGNLNEAQEASYRARELTTRLITFSRGGTPNRKFASLTDLLRNAFQDVKFHKSISVDMNLPDGLWPVAFDESQMGHVVKNLLTNAGESMPNGGTVRILVENVAIEDEGKAKTAFFLPAGRYIRIHFVDQGVGIPEENRDKVFDPYFSTKEKGAQKGMGLGLAIAYSIVKRHGGELAIESEVGVGTKVSILLPASRREEVSVPSFSEERVVNSEAKSGRVLIMDDDSMLRNVGRRLLVRMGYEVDMSEDGEEAIARVQSAKNAGWSYEFIILDLVVENGLGGKEAVRKILAIDPQASAIVSSGYSNDPIMTDFKQYGFAAALPKPYTLQDLHRILRSL